MRRDAAYKIAARTLKGSHLSIHMREQQCRDYDISLVKISRPHKSNSELVNMRNTCARMDAILRRELEMVTAPQPVSRNRGSVCARLRALSHQFLLNGLTSPETARSWAPRKGRARTSEDGSQPLDDEKAFQRELEFERTYRPDWYE